MKQTHSPFSLRHDGFRSGKVRDIYTFGERLLIVATDRISAYDEILPTLIPDKGRVLTGLSAFWFSRLGTPHHLIATNLDAMQEFDHRIDFGDYREEYEGRCMLVRKARVFPIECVVRGYLAGSGWKEYRQTGAVCGITLPEGLLESAKFPEPIYTPATKAPEGEHDENITFERTVETVGSVGAEALRRLSLEIYRDGAAYALERGIIIADTKFEFGLGDHPLAGAFLVDEVLTPDSSRFWPEDQYEPGRPQPSFDKQFVRDFVSGLGWNKKPPAPSLPEDIVARTREKYIEAYERLTLHEFPWK
ncbi:MAG: phosphoribosylaminoimidazole-succinocarboxamide synthase [Parcubacteria group bacterium Gr01-1014_38]|nr:MAG: phosphoribosylaminoimidazole-succinocarboxamide synthase [Parcubacteria group bacterium Gr01-1014_38]